jgi:hypothetical protein
LRFIIEEVEDSKTQPGEKVQALRNGDTIDKDTH